MYSCRHCDEVFFSPSDLDSHTETHQPGTLSFKLYKQVFGGASSIFRKKITTEVNEDPLAILSSPSFRDEVVGICIHQAIKRKRAYFIICAHAIFLKLDESGDVMDKICFVAATAKVQITRSQSVQDFRKIVSEKVKEIDERLQDFTDQGSNWTLSDLVFIDLTFSTLGGMRGGCSFKYPARRGLLNIESDDNLCLVYCVIAHFHQKSIEANMRKYSSSYKKYLKDFNLENLTFPMHPAEVEHFEKQNERLNFQINIFVEENNEVFPYRLPEYRDKIIINVLLVEGVLKDNQKVYHYILITDPSVFLQKKYFNDVGVHSYSTNIRCKKCFASFTSSEKCTTHEMICKTSKTTSLQFPKEWKKISYSKPWNGFPHLLCGFVDFESILIKDKGILFFLINYHIR